jgi:hypothetical protein
MARHLRQPLLVALAIAAPVLLSACGSSGNVTHAANEGINVHLGGLRYQVQLSRQLNPADPEDSAYLAGLAPAQQKLLPSQVWFGVFMRVENPSDQPHPTAAQFQISDTQNIVYKPLLPAASNPFAYRPISLDADSQLPNPTAPAASLPTQGEVLLFKLNESSYDNRPLELSFANPGDPAQKASVELDV